MTAADTLRQAAVRAIHALKSPPPDGSQHYQAGWDAGLEAAIDAVRDAFEQASALAVARQLLGTTSVQPTTAEKAAALDMAPTDYRKYCHEAAVEQIRDAAGGLLAETGLRVMDALAATEIERTLGHADDGQWHDVTGHPVQGTTEEATR